MAKGGPPIRDVSESKHTKLMIYGVSGIGKTRFVGSAGSLPARPGNEFGSSTLILRPPTDHTESIFGSGCKEWVIQDWAEMYDCLEYLRTEGGSWEWVFLDSVSLWQEIGLDDVWEAAKSRNSARAEFGRDKQEYGINQQRLGEWVRHVVGLDTFNFGITALPMKIEDPETNEDIFMPNVQGRDGKMSHMMCGYMNIVAYLSVKKGTKGVYRVLYTQQDGDHYAKDQYTALPNGGKLVRPTIPALMEAVAAARASHQPAKKPRRKARRVAV